MTQKKRLGLSIPIHMYEKLKSEAEYSGLTMNGLVIQILKEWTDKQRGETKCQKYSQE